MERRINKKLDNYFKEFKVNIKSKIEDYNNNLTGDNISELLQYIYDYETINLDPTDFVKRKRLKNEVPLNNRCCALRANKEQCTRRRKPIGQFCGTHIKGSPHGVVDINGINAPTIKRIEVWVENIKGIHYYLDNFNNVYCPQDITQNKQNPKVIAKYEKKGEEYLIPGLGIN